MAILGEAEWGYWETRPSGSSGSGGSGLSPGSGGAGGSNQGLGTGSGDGGASPGIPGVQTYQPTHFETGPVARPPSMPFVGYPQLSLGDCFDLDLDDQQGYADMDSNTQFRVFLSELDPEEG